MRRRSLALRPCAHACSPLTGRAEDMPGAPWSEAPLFAHLRAAPGAFAHGVLGRVNNGSALASFLLLRQAGTPASAPPGACQERIASSRASHATPSAVPPSQLGSAAPRPTTPPAKGGAPDTAARRACALRPTSEGRNCGQPRWVPPANLSIDQATRRSRPRPLAKPPGGPPPPRLRV